MTFVIISVSTAEDFLKMEKANYLGMSESIKEIYKIGETNQNIECIFGFSQGAEMLMFLVLLSLYMSFKTVTGMLLPLCTVLLSTIISVGMMGFF